MHSRELAVGNAFTLCLCVHTIYDKKCLKINQPHKSKSRSMSPPKVLIWCSAVVTAVCCMAAVSLATSDRKKELYFGLMGHQMPTEAKRGVEDALEDINNRNELLRGYELKYLHNAPILDSNGGQVL